MKFPRNPSQILRSGDPLALLVPVLAFAAAAALAAAEAQPAAAAESLFLALLIGGVVACVERLDGSGRGALAALAALTVLWTVRAGPSRGFAVTVLLLTALLVAGRVAWRRGRGAQGSWIAAAVGVQLLARPDLLLPPWLDARTLVSLLLLPAATGLALAFLGERFGMQRAAIAGAATVALGPGFNVTTTVALLGLAAGTLLAQRQGRLMGALAVAILAAVAVWKPIPGVILSLSGLVLWAECRWPSPTGPVRSWPVLAWPLLPAALAVGVGALAAGATGRGNLVTAAAVSLGLLLVPAGLAAALTGTPARRARAVAGGLVVVATALAGGGAEALAGGVVLLALSVPAAGMAAALQRGWSTIVAVAAIALAGFPFVRDEPLLAALGLLGIEPPWQGSAAVAVALAALATLADEYRRRAPGRPGGADAPSPARWAAAVLLPMALVPMALLAVVRWPVAVPHAGRPHLLTDAKPRLERPVEPAVEARQIVVDAQLVHGAGLEAGRDVAVLTLWSADGSRLARWPIAAGEDLAEWAAARPDVAALPGFEAPPAWQSSVAPDGAFFGRRYRVRRQFEVTQAVDKVVLRRLADLPAETVITVFRMELR